MHTVGDVVRLALKKLGVLRPGGEPKAADAADSAASLISWYQECINKGTFGRVGDLVVSEATEATAYPNVHINEMVSGVTINLPDTVPYDYWYTWRPCRDYGWGLNAPLGGDPGVNVPRDKSVIQITSKLDDTRATYIYDGTVQRWMRIDTLALTSEAPLSARGFDGLASVLATRLIDFYGPDLLSPSTIQSANSYKTALVTNHGNSSCEDSHAWSL